MLARDALQFRIPADGTMSVKRIAESHEAGMKTRLTLPASPGIDSEETKDVVRCVLAVRATCVFTLADRADHLGDKEPFGTGTE